MKYYIIAGEASGDLHASNLIKEIRINDPDAVFRGWGGDMMTEQNVHLVKHYRELAFMGFVEVLLNIRTILKNIEICKFDIQNFSPDVLILVDYPGFNLRIARYARSAGFKVVYYISPQVWAWKQSRVRKIKRLVDKMLVILPFEKAFYKKFDYDVEFVGHPLLDAIASNQNIKDKATWLRENNFPDKDIIALLPGSRQQEISTMLPLMMSVKVSQPHHLFIIGAAPSVPPSFYDSIIRGSDVKIVFDKSYELLQHAQAAMVTSGTATLETALLNVPEVVCYKGNIISYRIARWLIKVRYISLVNLIMDRRVVKELIQTELTTENLSQELNKLLHDTVYRNKMLADYKQLQILLGGDGASRKAASIIDLYLKIN